jgi:signal transduction histidine kinase
MIESINHVTSTVILIAMTCISLSSQSESTDILMYNDQQIDSLVEVGYKSISKDKAQTLSSIKTLENIAKEENNPRIESYILYLKSCYEIFFGDKKLAIQHADQSIAISKENNYKYIIAKNRHILGLMYQLDGQYDKAINEYFNALNINTELGKKSELIKQLNNISICMRELKDYEESLRNILLTEKVAKELGNDHLYYASKVNAAYVLLDQDKYDEARKVLAESEFYFTEKDNAIYASIFYNILSEINLGQDSLSQAYINARKALQISKEFEYEHGIISSNYVIANIFFVQKQFDKSAEISSSILNEIDEGISTRYVEQLYLIASKSYQKLNKPREALKYLEKNNALLNKIFDAEKRNLTMKLNLEYNLKEKEKENESLKRQVSLDNKLIRNQKYLYTVTSIIAILSLLFAYLIYKSLRLRQRYNEELETAIESRTKELSLANKELKSSNMELERFAFIASHDLKEPLRNIISFSSLIEKKISQNADPDNLKFYTSVIQRAGYRLVNLIESILSFSILKDTNPNFKNIDLNAILKETENSFLNTNIKITSSKLPTVKGDQSLLFSVFQNLIQNAVKYNDKEKPTLQIEASINNDMHIIQFIDNGIGIDKKYKDKIFKMFTRLNSRAEFEGSGLGLSLCQKIMNIHNGDIWLEDGHSSGCTFVISFPFKDKSVSKLITA